MKGPSLDAIRKFKEKQEVKKQEEIERKIKDKLNTLEHRAAQGDRKAKIELKKIEKEKDVRTKEPTSSQNQYHSRQQSGAKNSTHPNHEPKPGTSNPKPKCAIADFDQLMKLAQKNNNEMRKPEAPVGDTKRQPKNIARVGPQNLTSNSSSHRKHPSDEPSQTTLYSRKQHESRPYPSSGLPNRNTDRPNHRPEPRSRQVVPRPSGPRDNQIHRPRPIPGPSYIQNPKRPMHRYDDYDDENYEDDDYEDDGFVVDEEDSEVGNEVSNTIRSLFRYDRRRCDMREAAMDREYQRIGRVSTFEDLEREERRASRLAAEEDARAQRDEEERKRLKKLRLQKMR